MDLFLAISKGIGVSLATGVRTFVVPLFVGLMAQADAGVDFDHTGYSFLEAWPWIALMAALAVAGWLLDRSEVQVPAAVWVVVSMGLGAVLFAGVLEDDDYFGIGGLLPGMVCALIGFAAALVFLGGASDRLAARGEGAGTIRTLRDIAAIAIAALALFAPPTSLLALAFCGWVLIARRRRDAQKYEGLRILR